MLGLLNFALLIGAASALHCPQGYELEQDLGCIKNIYYNIGGTLDDLMPVFRAECAKDGAHLPIIKNAREDGRWSRIINYHRDLDGIWLIVDLVCNSETSRLEWADGSHPTYPDYLWYNFDCVTDQDTFSPQYICQKWYKIHNPYEHNYTVFCVMDQLEETTEAQSTLQPTTTEAIDYCGDYELMPSSEDNSQPCYKVYSQPQSWELAQKECAAGFGSLVDINDQEENDFFLHTAVVNNFLDGIHIGAHQSQADANAWSWSNGKAVNIFTNFISSFPVPGAGECVAMLTDSPKAPWINEDCTQNLLPFICRRAEQFNLPSTCPDANPKEGEEISPPTFPDSVVSCQYVLFVKENAQVELEILSLHAELTNEYLEIFEGPAGSNLIANLTGTIAGPVKLTTAQSNVMRVNWRLNGAVEGRGFKIRYNAIGNVGNAQQAIDQETTTSAGGSLTVVPLVCMCLTMFNFLM